MARKKKKAMSLKPGVKVWVSSPDGEGTFGGGKWRLLRAVAEKGSLMAAVEDLGISYRKAWGDLKKAEKGLKMTLIEKHRGGASGGDTCLTDQGISLLKSYEGFRAEIAKTVNKAFKKHF